MANQPTMTLPTITVEQPVVVRVNRVGGETVGSHASSGVASPAYYRHQRMPPTHGHSEGGHAMSDHGGGGGGGGGLGDTLWGFAGLLVVGALLYWFLFVFLPAQNTRTVTVRYEVAPAAVVPAPSFHPMVPATPVPSPAEIASRVPHHTSRVCVPCVGGYSQDPDSCECTRTTWVPAR